MKLIVVICVFVIVVFILVGFGIGIGCLVEYGYGLEGMFMYIVDVFDNVWELLLVVVVNYVL